VCVCVRLCVREKEKERMRVCVRESVCVLWGGAGGRHEQMDRVHIPYDIWMGHVTHMNESCDMTHVTHMSGSSWLMSCIE